MYQNAVCKLCGKSAKLIKKSHVIPDFMYRGIFDDLHRMILAPLTDVNQKPVYHQTGFTDKYILCYKCDNELIGSLEKYSSMILYGGKSKNPPVFERQKGLSGERSILIKHVDYKTFKLFILSILWRAHISTNKFFNKVNIFENELSIRKMLLSNTAGTEGIYKISIIGIKDNMENMVRALSDPEVKKLGDGYFATFFINGFVYFIDLDPPSDFVLFKQHFLKETGEIQIPILSGNMGNDFLKAMGIPDFMADYYITPQP